MTVACLDKLSAGIDDANKKALQPDQSPQQRTLRADSDDTCCYARLRIYDIPADSDDTLCYLLFLRI